jgi:4-amino-4-deoxy-L-arabinose transferase-like glycosyltransferase
MPPFVEYAILHLFLLSGGDGFVNLVQWFGMTGSVLAVSMIAGFLGARRVGQWLSAIFTITLPMGILQSTSTQTDYVAGFWNLCVIYYTLVLARQARSGLGGSSRIIPVMLGLSFSLGILTKGTIYAIVLPFLGYLLVTLIASRSWKSLIAAIVLGLVFSLGLNLPLWIRNYSTFASPLGPGAASLGSAAWNPLLAMSTALRDATNQLATPIGPGNKILYLLMQKVHQVLGLDLSDPRTTLGEYRIRFSYHEDYAGNPVHFLLGNLSILYIPILFLSSRRLQRGQKANRHEDRIVEQLPVLKGASLYSLLMFLAYCCFALLFKWQTTNSRLLLPWLAALGPLVGVVVETFQLRFPRYWFAIFLFLNGLPYLLSNPSRPVFDFHENESMLFVSRTDVQFYNSPEIQNELISVVEAARDLDCRSFGLELDSSTPEYLIWYVLAATGQEVDRVGSFNSIPEVSNLVNSVYRPCVVFCIECGVAREKGYELVYNRGALQLYSDPGR